MLATDHAAVAGSAHPGSNCLPVTKSNLIMVKGTQMALIVTHLGSCGKAFGIFGTREPSKARPRGEERCAQPSTGGDSSVAPAKTKSC